MSGVVIVHDDGTRTEIKPEFAGAARAQGFNVVETTDAPEDPHAGLRAALHATLVGGGAMAGGALGAGAGGVFGMGVGAVPGAIGGSGLGAAGGEAINQLISRATGGQAPATAGEAAGQIGVQGAIGAGTAGALAGAGLGIKAGAGTAFRMAVKNPAVAKLLMRLALHAVPGARLGADVLEGLGELAGSKAAVGAGEAAVPAVAKAAGKATAKKLAATAESKVAGEIVPAAKQAAQRGVSKRILAQRAQGLEKIAARGKAPAGDSSEMMDQLRRSLELEKEMSRRGLAPAVRATMRRAFLQGGTAP